MTFTDFVDQQTGSRNWVIARRTKRVLRQYGADVLTMTQKQYRALEKKYELATIDDHPALEMMATLFGGSRVAARSVLYNMRNAGWHVEKVHGE